MTSQSASPARNAELVRAGFQAFNSGDADQCLALAAPDLITNLAELPEPQHGRDMWRQGFEMMRRAFPDRATRGRTIEYVSHEFYRIADGLIAEEWICSDTATLLRQLS
jgi:ketosteroid isomerase-like protein